MTVKEQAIEVLFAFPISLFSVVGYETGIILLWMAVGQIVLWLQAMAIIGGRLGVETAILTKQMSIELIDYAMKAVSGSVNLFLYMHFQACKVAVVLNL